MKVVLLAVGLLGVAAISNGQAPAPSLFERVMESVSAKTVSRDGDVFHITGGLEITVGGMRLVADEAHANMRTRDVELRGNVHLLAPAN